MIFGLNIDFPQPCCPISVTDSVKDRNVVTLDSYTMTDELIKSWIVRDLGEGKNQPAHRILRGRLSRKTYLLFQFSMILRYFLKSEKSKHGPSVEFLEIKGVDRPMQGLS